MSWYKTASEVEEENKQKLLNKIARIRYEHETKGIEINGIVVSTDRQSQALITGAALSATRDENYTCRWKTKNGFVTLDANNLIQIADSVRDYVQACFDREKDILDAVENGSFEESMLEQGWPE